MRRRLHIPTLVGVRELVVTVSRALPRWCPGRAGASADGRLTIALRPEVLAALDNGDREARLVVAHELAHVVLHTDVLDGGPGRPRGDLELEADLLAGVIVALIGDRRPAT